MVKPFNNFLLMLQMLTRIPIPLELDCSQDHFKKGALFLPIVGVIIGGIQWGVYFILSRILPPAIVAAIIVMVGVIITGGLHVDGLGDTCDGFFAFKGKDKIIEIMKDSRVGTFACIAIFSDLLLKIIAITYCIEYKLHLVILVAPILSRFAINLISLIGKPAKKTGSGNLFVGNMSKYIVMFSACITVALSWLFLGFDETVITMLITIFIVVLFNFYSDRKIGGLTGDLLGATNELVEIVVLLVNIAIVYNL